MGPHHMCYYMHRITPFLLFISLLGSARGQTSETIEILSFEEFEPYLHFNSDTTYVLNFWATWCAPCVKELPFFDRLTSEMSTMPVRVLLVSLDFKNQLESKLVPFLADRNVLSEVIYLDAPNPNGWIDLVDPAWSGSLPATLIYQGTHRKLYEQSFEDYEELRQIVQSFYKI